MDWLEAFFNWVGSILSYYDNIEYENLGIGSSMPSAAFAVIGIYFGMVIACVISLYSKRYLAGFVNRLLETGATSPEKAITVREAGYSGHALIYSSLSDGNVVRKTVRAAEEAAPGDGLTKGRTNTRTARFYIPEEKAEGARIRYNRKHTNLVVAVIAVIVLTVIGVLVYLVLPGLLRILDNLITIFKNR